MNIFITALIISSIVASVFIGFIVYKSLKKLGKRDRFNYTVFITIFFTLLAFTLFYNAYLDDLEDTSNSYAALLSFWISYFTAALLLLIQTAFGKITEKEQKDELLEIKNDIIKAIKDLSTELKRNNGDTHKKLNDLQIKVAKLQNKDHSSESVIKKRNKKR